MWRVSFSRRIESDVTTAAAWYEAKILGLGQEFMEEIIVVWHSLAENPLLGARKHPTQNLRWRYPVRFPYRIIYEVDEVARTVVVLAVLHAARNDQAWRTRL